jgi:hypothetical protein
MSAANTIQELNREEARRIVDAARNDPTSAYIGKYVGIANGRVVVVADNWHELARRLRQAEPDPSKTFGVEVGIDYDAVQEIWGIA